MGILTPNYLDYAVASIVSGMVVVPILFRVNDVSTVVVDRGAILLSKETDEVSKGRHQLPDVSWKLSLL